MSNTLQEQESIFDISVDKLLELTASKSPTPGGGAISAVVATFGCSLLAMVGRLTDQKKGYESAWEISSKTWKRAETVSGILKLVANKDIASFQEYIDVLKLPRNFSGRKKKLKLALIKITESPFGIIIPCIEMLTLALEFTPYANRNAISDISVAVHLWSSAANAAIETILLNLNYRDKDVYYREITEKCKKYRLDVFFLQEKIVKLVKKEK